MTSLNEHPAPRTLPTQTSTSSAEKPKRVRRPHHRRPKALPTTIRQRLAILGRQPRSNDTTDSNLSDLIDKLNSDLQSYTLAAERWQKMFMALQAGESQEKSKSEGEEEQRNGEDFEEELDLGQDGITPAQYEIFGRIQRTMDPTLSLVSVTAPKVRSAVSLSNTIVWGDEAFETVLHNISTIANLFGIFKGHGGSWGAISSLKPDFSEAQAKRIWADVFQPVDASFNALNWTGSSSVRRPSLIAPEDEDFDALDRKLMNATDDEVVDMLHYCSLLIVGFGHSVIDDKRYSEARDHLGVNCERLLREIIFTRNLSSNPQYAQGVLAGMIGMIRFFSMRQRFGAVVSLLEMGWQICAENIAEVHPITKGLISFVSTVMAPSPARRSLWMARNQEIFQSTNERYFHLSTSAYFTAAYYALTTGDEDSLLYYLSMLEDHLAPKGEARDGAVSGPFYDDPSICFTSPARKAQFLGYPPESPTQSYSSTSETQPPVPVAPFASFTPGSLPIPADANNPLPFPGTSSLDGLLNTQPYYLHNSQSSFPSSSSHSHQDETRIPCFSDVRDCACSHATEFIYPAPFKQPNSDPSTPSTVEVNTSCNHFIPNEDFKTVLRSASHLIRAEAALLTKNYATCRYWVDEAEREVRAVTDIFFHHKVFLIDVSLLKTIFTATCPFPNGTHCVAEEFEIRIKAEAERRKARKGHNVGTPMRF